MTDWWEENQARTVNAKRKKESSLEAYFVKQVRGAGMGTDKWRAHDRRGVPDRVVYSHTGVLLVELKTETGVISKSQKYLHRKLSDNWGIPVFILYGKGGVDKWIQWVLQLELTTAPVKYTYPVHIR